MKQVIVDYIPFEITPQQINEFCGLNDKSDVVKDEYVIQTMRYLELLKELKKSGNKNKKVV